MSAKAIWITWERQTRNSSMAELLEAEYCELISKYKGIVRYVELTIKTIRLIMKNQTKVIYFQNPSVVLGIVCTIAKILFGNRFVVVGDFHNCALDDGWISFLNKKISKNIDITLVSNKNLEEKVIDMGGTPFSFADPIPVYHSHAVKNDTAGSFILFISSWADDEPIVDVCNAYINSKLIGQGVKLLVTGRVKQEKLDKPITYYIEKGIEFLGFVSEEKYWELLQYSHFNIDLTTRSNCMVCGAYESIAVKNGALLSNNEPTMAYFEHAAFYTDNTCVDIEKKILECFEQRERLKKLATEKNIELVTRQAVVAAKLKEMIFSVKP